MAYERLKPAEFFERIKTEEDARNLFWRAKFEGKEFECPRCFHPNYYQYRSRAEVRECRQCNKHVRLRPGTMLERSKVPVLTWLHAIFFITQDKRGVSGTQLKRLLGMTSDSTIWNLLHKVRVALGRRDERYTLKNIVELDGANFDDEAKRKASGKGETKVLLAVETKDWVDARGREKQKAGFAKIVTSRETSIFAQDFVDNALDPGTLVNADGGNAFTNLQGVDVDQRVMGGQPNELDSWLPWVHKFISNAKTWLLGTHHSVSSKYLDLYLAEYTYRFNRRHDPDGLFHRAVTACALSTTVTRMELRALPA